MPNEEDKKSKTLELAADVRKFEINLFWQRSLFFWGFVAASFVGYATLMKDGSDNNDLALIIACFGFICSVAWSLANRGSKYWQLYWELEVEKIEGDVLSHIIFGKDIAKKPSGHWWLRPRRYSVSKLATALSDFAILVWVALIVRAVGWDKTNVCENPKALIALATMMFALLMLFACRSGDRERG